MRYLKLLIILLILIGITGCATLPLPDNGEIDRLREHQRDFNPPFPIP